MPTAYKIRSWWRGRGRPQPSFASLWDHLAAVYGQRLYVRLKTPMSVAGATRDVLSYRDVCEAVARSAEALHGLGVQPGERVVLCSENRFDYAVHLFALARLGAVCVPLHPKLTHHDVQARLHQSQASTLLADPHCVPSSGGSYRVITPDKVQHLAQRCAPRPPATIADDAPIAVLYTSGTTGTPKGAVLTSRTLMSMRPLFEYAPNPTDEHGVYCLPTSHMMALSTVIYVAFGGGTLHWRETFDAEDVLTTIERTRATFFVGVPAMYGMLLRAGARQRDLASIRFWVSSADVMPPEWVAAFTQLGCALPTPGGERLLGSAFLELFGMVELSGAALCKITPPPWAPSGQVRSSVVAGPWNATFPLPPYRTKILNAEGNPVAHGDVGVLWIKGPGVTRGYENDPSTTARTIRDGWLCTGDLARRRWWGSLDWVGRSKDVIKHGGYSVFPAEVEEQLLQHPAIDEALVFAAPHPTKGEVPVAVVVLAANAPDRDRSAQALHTWAREYLNPMHSPRAIAIARADEIPRNLNDKAMRSEAALRFLPIMNEQFPSAFHG